jgi:hypothetical protein
MNPAVARRTAIDYIISQSPEPTADLRRALEVLSGTELEDLEAAVINSRTPGEIWALFASIASRAELS